MLIHQGKVLKDETTLEENKVDKNNFVVVMLSPTCSCAITYFSIYATYSLTQAAAAGGMPNANPLNQFPHDLADTMTHATPHTDWISCAKTHVILRPSLDLNRQLDLATNCGKQPPSQIDAKFFEDSLVKALTECMIDAKENLDGNFFVLYS